MILRLVAEILNGSIMMLSATVLVFGENPQPGVLPAAGFLLLTSVVSLAAFSRMK